MLRCVFATRKQGDRMTSADTAAGQPAWRKSRRSIGNGECVEIASVQDGIMIRDSADPAGPVIRCTARAWLAFLAAAKAGKPHQSG
jgi:hypothetical protein